MIEDFAAKIAQNGMEISQLTAKHAVEKERLEETIEDYKRMLFDHREKINALINTHQKTLAETDQYFGQEINSLKQEIHSLQNQLNQQIRKNVALNDELQRSNKIREELSVRLRAEREIQNKLKDAPGFQGAQSRPLQESSFGKRVSLPSPILTAAHPFDTGRTPATSFPAPSHLPPPREESGDPGVSEVTDALALQSLSSQSQTEKPKAGASERRSFVGGRDPSALSDEENALSYPMKIKRKKLFSEESTRCL
nr:PREDICTED: uncharacterized protein LOC109035530 [Bemisia tabaci]